MAWRRHKKDAAYARPPTKKYRKSSTFDRATPHPSGAGIRSTSTAANKKFCPNPQSTRTARFIWSYWRSRFRSNETNCTIMSVVVIHSDSVDAGAVDRQ